MTSWRTFIACVAVLGSGLVACSDDGGNKCDQGGGLSNCPEPRIGIVPATNPIEISEAGLAVGVPSSTYVVGAVLIVVLSVLAAALPSAEAWRLKITDALRKV